MEELERLLNELRQGLGQHVFRSFDQLQNYMTAEDSISMIADELDKVREQFAGASGESSLFLSLNALETQWKDTQQQAVAQNDYDRIMEAEEVLRAIKHIRYAEREST